MKNKNKIINKNLSLDTRYQSGLSLVELMISMVIGLFMLAGVITSFVGTKDSDHTRNAISEMDANASAVFSVMRQTISHAGYTSIHGKLLDKGFYTPVDGALPNPTCRDGSMLRDVRHPGATQRTRDRSRGDTITVVALADNPCLAGSASCPGDVTLQNPEAKVFTDCTGGGADRDIRTVQCSADEDVGMVNPSDAKIYSTFRLSGRTLRCDGSRGGTQPLVDNVEAMQIMYGVRQENGTTLYSRANVVEINNNWGLVTSVQIGLLLRSSRLNLLKSDGPNRYALLDRSIRVNQLRRLYRVYTTTINLANQNR
ncbi:MAG: PilW family protein [Cocleimonas sp.]